MKDNEQEILEKYDIEAKNIKKVREGILCESREGLFLIKELRFSEKRLGFLEELGKQLRQKGCDYIDWIVQSKEGELFCVAEDGTKHFVKKWFVGKECDIHRERDILSAVTNLAKIHKALRSFDAGNEQGYELAGAEDLRQEYFRHNREMKKVRSFMRNKVDKGEFELTYLKHFDSMYAAAEATLEQLKASDYEEIRRRSVADCTVVHGDYNYHNIIMSYAGVATTNFEHAQRNVQVADLYYFLRKTMEKNQWDVVLGDKILNCYQKELPFHKGELECLAICIAYPEKFWKVANSYHRSRKVWLPAKNSEKLEMVIKQTEEKEKFLRNIFAFQL